MIGLAVAYGLFGIGVLVIAIQVGREVRWGLQRRRQRFHMTRRWLNDTANDDTFLEDRRR